MKQIGRRVFVLVWLAAALLMAVALAHCVSAADTPVIAMEGGTIQEEAAVVSGTFAVSGTVQGLPADGTVTLTLNAMNPVAAKDGPFAFPAVLSSGQAYAVVATMAVTPGYACAVANGAGTIMSADVTNVTVTCGSSDATLDALSLSDGPLAPAFAPATLAYTAPVHVGAIFGTPTTGTVTATPHDPAATIKVNGAAVTSGAPSGAITFKLGANAIDVQVTASDRVTVKHYTISATGTIDDYIKASNARIHANFGDSVALSGDGNTLAVGSITESGGTSGIGGNQADTSVFGAGAVYVFARAAGSWTQQAYIKSSHTGFTAANFGTSVALSTDGNTLIVGAPSEASNATGVGGLQTDTSAPNAGAAYVFTRAGTTWTQQAYLKASNTRAGAAFGGAVAISGDGNTAGVGSSAESSNATGVNGDMTAQADTSASNAGAVYVFARTGTTWAQQTYVKAFNTRASTSFGASLALSTDGSTLAVGSIGEASNATTINGSQSDTSAPGAGAVYVYLRTVTTWATQAYVKASNARAGAGFGAVALSGDGNTLAVGSNGETSNATGVGGNQADTSLTGAGAAYVFLRTGSAWAQQAYVKASNPATGASFGTNVALSLDGSTLAVSAVGENGASPGVNGDQTVQTAAGSGAAYVFLRAGTAWSQKAYVKASNPVAGAIFGTGIGVTSDTFAVGSTGEYSNATGINGNQLDVSAYRTGAAYVY